MAKKYDFSLMPNDVAEVAFHLAEKRLDATVQFGLAADQRAMVQAGIFGAMAAAALAVIATLPSEIPNLLATGIGIGAFVLIQFIACGLSILAARPIKFFAAGYHPERLAPLTGAAKMHQYLAEDFAVRIDANDKLLDRAALLTVAGFWTAFSAIPTGIVTYHFSSCLMGSW